MKPILIILALVLSVAAYAQTPDWENPNVLGINKLPYHSRRASCGLWDSVPCRNTRLTAVSRGSTDFVMSWE